VPSNVRLVEIFRKVWEISVPRLSAILPDNQVNRLVSSYRLTSLVLDVAVKNRLSAIVDKTRIRINFSVKSREKVEVKQIERQKSKKVKFYTVVAIRTK